MAQEVGDRHRLRQLLDETARGAREVAPVMPGPLAVAMRRIPEPPPSEDAIKPTVAAPTSNDSVDNRERRACS